MTKLNSLLFILFIFLVVLLLVTLKDNKVIPLLTSRKTNYWKMESIDTVKYSRDPARQYNNDPSFDKTIELQVRAIAYTGANYIAISTPYDAEFIPFLSRWVVAARKYNLKVWFRGNFAGWEGWFNYKKIDRSQHKAKLKEFISQNSGLFKDGDIFTSCTECENGGPGDPRNTGDIEGHRQFLIEEYNLSKDAFVQIGLKNITTNYYPMNLDVAKLIMDPATTQQLGGVSVIDHYVKTPENLNDGINEIANISQGKVILGEFGAPIPDIQGEMTPKQQADWLKSSLILLSRNENLIGLNYWTSFGGSTALWADDGTASPAVSILASFYKPKALRGIVKNEAGAPISEASFSGIGRTFKSDNLGRFYIPFLINDIEIDITKEGYFPSAVTNLQDNKPVYAVLKKKNEDLLFTIHKFLYKNLSI